MRRVIGLLSSALIATAPAGVAHAQSVPISASGFAFSTVDPLTDQSMGPGPSPSSDGYIGTFSYDFAVGGASLSYLVCYTVSYYDRTSGAWMVYDRGYKTMTASAGSSGTAYIDFVADLSQGIPDGAYQLSAWVCTGTASDITAVLGGADDTDSLVAVWPSSTADCPEPLPQPEPSPGPCPGTSTPIITPPIPPSGPIGPGTSMVAPAYSAS